MPEEKELTVEEMKSLVSLATLLPALLDKIAIISRDVADLKASFTEIKTKFNGNTNAVIEYKKSVDELIKKQPDIQPIVDGLEAVKQTLVTIEMGMNLGARPVDKPAKKPSTPKAPKKAAPKDEDKEKVEEIVDKILASHRGRKSRTLTIIDIKNGFKVDEIIAAKVLAWLEKNGMYNPKLHILTYPKR